MLSPNQSVEALESHKDETTKDNLQVVDLGRLVANIKADLQHMGADLEAVDKISLDEINSMTAAQLKEKVGL